VQHRVSPRPRPRIRSRQRRGPRAPQAEGIALGPRLARGRLRSGESSVHCRRCVATREREHVATTPVMWIHVSFALLLQAVSPLEAPVGASTRPVTSVLEAANNAVLEFLATWRGAWYTSAPATGGGNDFDGIRLRDVHCHWDGSFQGNSNHAHPPSMIHHNSRRSMCPNWYPTGEFIQPDERVDRDGALAPYDRGRVC